MTRQNDHIFILINICIYNVYNVYIYIYYIYVCIACIISRLLWELFLCLGSLVNKKQTQQILLSTTYGHGCLFHLSYNYNCPCKRASIIWFSSSFRGLRLTPNKPPSSSRICFLVKVIRSAVDRMRLVSCSSCS